MEGWTGNLVRQPAQGIQITEWWEKELAQLPKKTRKLKAALMILCRMEYLEREESPGV